MARRIQSAAVIGARGQMGALFVRSLRGLGLQVSELNRPLDPEAVRSGLAGADLALLCVPVDRMQEVLERIVPALGPHCILADVCSVKVRPLRQMLDAFPGAVAGTHPLFGGTIPQGFTPRTALCAGRGEEALAAVRALFSEMGFNPFDVTAEEHDLAMAAVQGLNYVGTVAYLASLREIEGIERFVTPSFQRRLDSARKMLTEDRDLFSVIVEANPFSHEVVRRFRSFLNVAAGGDVDLLAAQAGWWWRDKDGQGRD